MSNDVQSEDSTILTKEMSPAHTKSINVLHAGIAVDSKHIDIYFEEGVCYNGEVNFWKKTHGFLKHVNENNVSTSFFFHVSKVNSTDKKIVLRKNMEVRFKIQRGKDGEKDCVIDVESRKGLPLNFHAKYGKNDKYDRQIKYDGRFFNGTITFFSRKKSYGRVAPVEEELASVGSSIKELGRLYFDDIDIDVVDFPIKIYPGDEVRFQIYMCSCKSRRSRWGAMNLQMQNGDQIPMLTKEDREAKILGRNARREELKKQKNERYAEKYNSKEYIKYDSGKRRRQKQRNLLFKLNKRNLRVAQDAAEPVIHYEEINERQRFIGTVTQFKMYHNGFVSPDEPEKLMTFGNIKNSQLCFRCQEIQTDQRPVRVDKDMKVSFTIVRLHNKSTLYANDIRTVDGQFIIPESKYVAPKPKELLSNEIVEGTIFFYNLRRGHGRLVLNGEDESILYFFQRDDLRSLDKVPGVHDRARVTCQKVNDPKGLAVTNIMDENRLMLKGFDSCEFRKKRSKSKKKEKS